LSIDVQKEDVFRLNRYARMTMWLWQRRHQRQQRQLHHDADEASAHHVSAS